MYSQAVKSSHTGDTKQLQHSKGQYPPYVYYVLTCIAGIYCESFNFAIWQTSRSMCFMYLVVDSNRQITLFESKNRLIPKKFS